MSEVVIQENISPAHGGIGGLVMVLEDFNDESEVGNLTIEVQIFDSISRREDMASLTIECPKEDLITANMLSLQSGAAYAVCVIAQVGTKVWADFNECKKLSKSANPSAGAKQTWKDALACLSRKAPGISVVFVRAVTSCDFLLP